ncbi:MAG: DinB family protein [Dehalococcoidia bacterium]
MFTVNEYLVHFIGRLNEQYAEAVADLTDEQLYYRVNDETCHIAFHTWHWLRTEDNVLNFVCQDRKAPLWLRRNLHEAWKLPKIDQGTGMDRADAHALRVPSAEALAQYARDVQQDVLPYLQSVSEEGLQTVTKVVPFGERTKLQHIGETLIAHGNGHRGQINVMRALQGLSGDPI